jgi:hypothetical protein
VLLIVIPGVLLAGLGLFQIFRSNQPEKIVEKKVIQDEDAKSRHWRRESKSSSPPTPSSRT